MPPIWVEFLGPNSRNQSHLSGDFLETRMGLAEIGKTFLIIGS